ncbi:MAG TPA: YtxH domain-containing protein [Amoebophilaceae bacterium]|jgi:gas vesicle protein|nr:YtxH domain-containing protein [Amoebophilaceae bacterium]
MRKRTENGIILCLGVCLGGIIGILAAPTKGAEVRSGLAYNLKLYQQKLRSLIAKLLGNKLAIKNQAKDTGQELITDVVHSAEKILKELDTLAAELEGKTS